MREAALQKKPKFESSMFSEIVLGLVEDGFLNHKTAKMLIDKFGGHYNKFTMELISKQDLKHDIDGTPLTLDVLTEWFAGFSNHQYIKIDPMKINSDIVTHLVPEAFATRHTIFPIDVDEKNVVIAVSDPFKHFWIDDLERVLKKKVVMKVASSVDIKACIREFYVVHNAVKDLSTTSDRKEVTSLIKSGKTKEIDNLIKKRSDKFIGEDSAIIKIVDWLLVYAVDERASDIHLEPKSGMCNVRFRVDGVLRVVYKLDPEIFLPVLNRFKILSELKVDEKRKPQDGQIKKVLNNGKQIEMRVSTIPTHLGEKLVIRIFDSENSQKSLNQLGFSDEDLQQWNELINLPYGFIAVTGPTGSGKSTTLYSSLKTRASDDVNICTIEDPIEVVNENYSQVQINEATNVTFANAIRAFLRQDPDIIMVGEVRDLDSAEMAVQASLTGHLVFSTLHTNDALSTITRLMDLGVAPYLLTSALKGILAQRLVRNLCPHCKEKHEIDDMSWASITPGMHIPKPNYIFKAKGCDACKNTGYIGRSVIYELITMNDQIISYIEPNIDIQSLKAKTQGTFKTMRENGIQRVVEGITTIEEVLKVTI